MESRAGGGERGLAGSNGAESVAAVMVVVVVVVVYYDYGGVNKTKQQTVEEWYRV